MAFDAGQVENGQGWFLMRKPNACTVLLPYHISIYILSFLGHTIEPITPPWLQGIVYIVKHDLCDILHVVNLLCVSALTHKMGLFAFMFLLLMFKLSKYIHNISIEELKNGKTIL